jgi:DNA-binding IclR family transcriptional regulator
LAIKTTFKILDFLKNQDRPVTGAEVAQELGIPHATAMSHLTTLEEINAVQRSGSNYEMGFKMATFWIEAKKHLEAQRVEIDRKLELINF